MAMTTLEVLKQARALIASPEHWTQGALAHTCDGGVCGPTDPDATNWCAIGAVWSATHGNKPQIVDSIAALADVVPNRGPITQIELQEARVQRYNDNPATDHQTILDLFDRAIEMWTDAS